MKTIGQSMNSDGARTGWLVEFSEGEYLSLTRLQEAAGGERTCRFDLGAFWLRGPDGELEPLFEMVRLFAASLFQINEFKEHIGALESVLKGGNKDEP